MSSKNSLLNTIYFDNQFGWQLKPNISIDNLGGISLNTQNVPSFDTNFNFGDSGDIYLYVGNTTVGSANFAQAGNIEMYAGNWTDGASGASGGAGSIILSAGTANNSSGGSGSDGFVSINAYGKLGDFAAEFGNDIFFNAGYNATSGGSFTFLVSNTASGLGVDGGGYVFNAANSPDRTGGSYIVNAGDGTTSTGTGSFFGGSIELFAGKTKNNGEGIGGSISIYGANNDGGQTPGSSDAGGHIRIKAGDGYKTNSSTYPYGKSTGFTTNSGGNLTLAAGNTARETGGNITITAGNRSDTGGSAKNFSPGIITLNGGFNIMTSASAPIQGGDIILNGGGVDGAPSSAFYMLPGNIILTGGPKQPVGSGLYKDGYRDGYVKLDSGNNTVKIASGITYKTTTPVSYPYTCLKGDYIVLVDTSSARTINLPDGSNSSNEVGDVIIIKDNTGSAGINNITVDGNGKNIEGSPTKTISSAFGILQVIYTGTEWKTFGGGAVPDATTSSKGAIQLANDLDGTASAPVVQQISGNGGTVNIAADTWMFYKDKFPYIYLENQDDGNSANEFTIQGQNSSNNGGGGGHIKLFAGHATAGTGNDAGDVWVFAGDIQGSATGNAGQLILNAGNTESADAGGSAFLESGYSMLGDGGLVQIKAGDAFASTKTGGSVNIISGGSTSSGVNSGNISISSKVAHNNTGTISIFSSNTANGNSGAISLTSGTATASTKSSGSISIISGTSAAGSSGSIQLTTGNASTATGSISITTGNASGGNASGITVVAGNGNSGGVINVTAGNSTNSGGSSGSMAFTSGDATAGNVNGGNIAFNLGTGFGTGVRGAFSVNSASAIVLDGNVGLARGLNQTSSTISTNTTLSSATNALYSLYLVTAGVTLTLPATPLLGTTLTISDFGGGAAGSNIIIAGNGFNINGTSSYTINTNYGAATLHFTGSVWVVISKA